jgi:hypothetical protein
MYHAVEFVSKAFLSSEVRKPGKQPRDLPFRIRRTAMKPSKIEVVIPEILKVALVIMCAASISGCGTSFLASRDTNPVIQDYATTNLTSFNRAVVFATTASRRLAIVAEDKDALGKVVTCAEPPPDVGEAFASAIAAGLQAAGSTTPATGTKTSVDVAGQYGRSVATQIAPLIYRTQGLQLYRDSIYKLCIDRMNNWIKEDSYNSESKYRFDEAIKLIEKELPLMEKTANAFYENVKAGDAKVKVDDVVSILEAQKK